MRGEKQEEGNRKNEKRGKKKELENMKQRNS